MKTTLARLRRPLLYAESRRGRRARWLQLFSALAFIGQLLAFFRIQQYALGGDADPDDALAAVFKTVRAGAGFHARQAQQALVPAQADVPVVAGIGKDGDLVAER